MNRPSLIPHQIVSSRSATSATEDGAEESLELLAVDAIDDEVDGRVEGHHQVRDLRQRRDGDRHQLKNKIKLKWLKNPAKGWSINDVIVLEEWGSKIL